MRSSTDLSVDKQRGRETDRLIGGQSQHSGENCLLKADTLQRVTITYRIHLHVGEMQSRVL